MRPEGPAVHGGQELLQQGRSADDLQRGGAGSGQGCCEQGVRPAGAGLRCDDVRGRERDAPGPMEIMLAPDGLTVWIADYGTERIMIRTRPNRASTGWTSRDTVRGKDKRSGGFRSIRNLTVASDGLAAWVVDGERRRVSMWKAVCPSQVQQADDGGRFGG